MICGVIEPVLPGSSYFIRSRDGDGQESSGALRTRIAQEDKGGLAESQVSTIVHMHIGNVHQRFHSLLCFWMPFLRGGGSAPG